MKKHTYCNPVSIPNIPRGKDEWYKAERAMFSHENKPDWVKSKDYRSISDPTVFYYDNKWYLYPSYGMAWVSEDFINWKHHRTEPYCPKYSPCIIPWKDKFLLTSWFSPLYVGDTPLGPFTELGEFVLPNGETFKPCDPCIFKDDDDRIYLYAFNDVFTGVGDEFEAQIIGYELDKENPTHVVDGPVLILKQNPKENPWERRGAHNQDENFGWIEGPHMLKHNGRYYMIYACPDTCEPTYCMAVYYSDESPLHGFKCQKKNPLTSNVKGIVSGPGHGCVEHGPNGSLWAFYTVIAPSLHRYERRIGMDPVAVDENGELYCPCGITDTPAYSPLANRDIVKEGNITGDVSVTGWIRPEASSSKEGREALYATDESVLTWWEPAKEDKEPVLTCDLYANYDISSARLFWRDGGLDYGKGIVPGPIGYVIEGFDGEKWFTLLDRTDNEEELNIDYNEFDVKTCNQVRLIIKKYPKGITPGVIDFTIFGKRSKK